MIDYAFLVVISLFAIFTPKESDYKLINLVLAGKFAIFIGAHAVTVKLGLFDGMYVDIYRAVLDGVFIVLFYFAGGLYLSFLCLIMALFHMYNMQASMDALDYFGIMAGFQILQLMYAAWGLIDGIDCRICSSNDGRHINHNSHT